MADSYVVTGPLATVKVGENIVYLYKDAPIPASADKDGVEHLLAIGLISKVGTDEVPAKSAAKGDWEAFARTQGATDADLEGKSKDDLIAAYGA